MANQRSDHKLDELDDQSYTGEVDGDGPCDCDICEVAFHATCGSSPQYRALICSESHAQMRLLDGVDCDTPSWENPVTLTERFATWFENCVQKIIR